MEIEEVMELWKPAQLARVLDTTTQNISAMIKKRQIPPGRQYELQVKSGGRLVASSYDPNRNYMDEANLETGAQT